jgi:pimeloyl-ACP methyl ester carboxylesterase
MSKVVLLPSTGKPNKLPRLIALHCSGSTGRQWRKLAAALGDRFALTAPDLTGAGVTPHWSGEWEFTLADEAARIVAMIDAQDGPVHLIGHSYGGGVALRIACERPARVASLSLYEPSAFFVLRLMGLEGRPALDEIRAFAGAVAGDLMAGDCSAAAARFFDYWNGPGTWVGAKPETQAELVRYIRKAPLEFSALINEPTRLFAFTRLACPVLLMRGARGPAPTALIADKLLSIMRDAALEELPDAGHMGPFSHPERVNGMIAGHVMRAAGLDVPAGAKTRTPMPVMA